MKVRVTGKRKNERGASLVEYVMLVAMISIVVIGIVRGFGVLVGDSVMRSTDSINEATGGVKKPPLGG